MDRSPTTTRRRAASYVAWVDRRRRTILAVAVALVVAGSLLAARRLPLLTDLSNLLPPQARSVRDLEEIQRRSPSLGLALCVVASADPERRAQATRRLADRLRGLDRGLLLDVVADQGAARRFAWDHRFLFAPLGDLEAARDVLSARLRHAKLKANPLFVSLDAGDADAEAEPADRARMDSLRRRLRDAEEAARHPAELVSPDGTLQLLIVETTFPSAATAQGQRLLAALDNAVAATAREAGPGVSFGITEDVIIAVAEHEAILRGLWLAIALTVAIVGASMLLYFGSLPALLALFGALAVGTMATFGVAALGIGRLNSVTAFLSAIVIGNGINYPILVLARHLEARRRGEAPRDALATALGGSFTGTLTAALAAACAYGCLVVTDFRGFRDFGVMGGIGMLLCWAATYVVLPALLAELERRGLVRAAREPRLGRWIGRLLPRRADVVVAVSAVILLAAAAATWRYLRADPYEYNWHRMRSDSAAARLAQRWMERIDAGFGRQFVGGFVVGAPTDAAADEAERILRARAEDEPGVDRGQALFRRVSSIHDLVPLHQERKQAVLAEIRRLCDDKLLRSLDDADADDVRALRPPDDIRPLTDADVPTLLARKYCERDGSSGRLLFANQASRFDGWNGRDMIAFADSVRALALPAGTAMGGGAFVFADVLRAVAHAGPRATAVALAGVALIVLLVVGVGRHALVTLLAVVAGTTLMIAIGAALGLRINFLDFVALPITLGISVDYAVNVVARERADGSGSARHALVTTGGAVVLCSWTTIVGYASLLLSSNAGIRSFGLVAILGELTCLLAALTLAPALLEILSRRKSATV
ncbi:MAG TPA: MMPL family transporter [Polyangia bacterium]|nr:MMPL family transporter [Polyangia bacterium]